MKLFIVTRTHPLPSLRSGFPLSTCVERGKTLFYNVLRPLFASAERGLGGEYMRIIKKSDIKDLGFY
jgi:hypothetical protein